LEELLRVAAARHGIEELFEAAKGEVGLAHYEVRSWTGWHHHVTLSLLALWFLRQERERLGKKTPALTVQQTRALFSRLLRNHPPSAAAIARESSTVLRRNVEDRIYAWHAATGRPPPPLRSKLTNKRLQ